MNILSNSTRREESVTINVGIARELLSPPIISACLAARSNLACASSIVRPIKGEMAAKNLIVVGSRPAASAIARDC